MIRYNNLFDGRKISNFGYGLYKGEESNLKDKKIIEIIIYGLNRGINVIDTAQRYRNGRSEKLIKDVLKKFKKRENLIIISKAGLIPSYIKKKNILKKLSVKKSNCFEEMDFSIDPKYINWSVNNSLKLMGTNYIDFYLLHNPELSLLLKNGHKKIIEALKVLEKKRKEKKILFYGIATWNGFRRINGNNNQLNIEKILKDLEKEVGKEHGFRCIEAPLSLGMPDLLNFKTNKDFNFGTFLNKHKINFFSSASLYEGNLEKLVKLNKIFNSTSVNKDLLNETKKADVSFPLSENSLRRLFILLENFRKNKILIENVKFNFIKLTNIFSININFLKNLPFITSSLIGMDEKKFVTFNLEEFAYKLKVDDIKKIKRLWKKIKANL
tara:strand:+ start:162 stop:1310 length:1149 start_codon:yes stop_codon:yes gene_type:complete